jgi:hypothetical protein
LAVCHGSFGRVTVYRLDKPMRIHAHREGHLTFDLGAPPAIVTISSACGGCRAPTASRPRRRAS